MEVISFSSEPFCVWTLHCNHDFLLGLKLLYNSHSDRLSQDFCVDVHFKKMVTKFDEMHFKIEQCPAIDSKSGIKKTLLSKQMPTDQDNIHLDIIKFKDKADLCCTVILENIVRAIFRKGLISKYTNTLLVQGVAD